MRNDSALRAKAAFIACGSLYPPLMKTASVSGEQERSEHPRQVELDRVQRDGVRQIFLVDERGQQRLIRRASERLRDARHERQRHDVPDLDDVEIHQDGERARRGHLDVLRRHQRLAAVVAIGEHAADEREEDDRQLLQERVEAEVERRIGQREDQPVLRDDLHPRADGRTAGADPLDAEIPVGEGRQHAPQAALERRGRLAAGDVGKRGLSGDDRLGGFRGGGFCQMGPKRL